MAASVLALESVTTSYGTRTLLDAVTIGLLERERVGVVGRNGGGKSTLLDVLSGRRPVESGRVVRAGGLRIGHLPQGDVLDPRATVRELVVGTGPEHAWASDPAVRDVLHGLFGGVDATALPGGLDAEVGRMSGGERRRVALAQLLVSDADVLLLDEPTNHLDVEGIAWLAAHLAARPATSVVVTHDRWFLDAVCTRTWEVVDGSVHSFDGGYAAYVLAKAERTRVAAADEARRQNLLRKELAWLRRGPPARTSKPRFRIDAANALIADEPPARDEVELVRFATARLGKRVLELHDVTVDVGGRRLLDDVTWDVGPGERIGVVGVNGSGKTTLLRVLAGQLEPTRGSVARGTTVRLGVLSQETTELDPDVRVLEAVEEVRRYADVGKGRTLSAGQVVERLGFVGERQWTPVRQLSGGERRRLQLARVLMDEPNVLLLDEPTNDLDLETLTAVEDILDSWAGTLVVVSHDRYFLERTCRLVRALLGDGRLRELVGGVDEYLALRAGVHERPDAVAPSGPPPVKVDPRQARKELVRIERQLDRITQEETRLHDEMAQHATDHERVLSLDEQLRALVAERAHLEERWLVVAEDATT